MQSTGFRMVPGAESKLQSPGCRVVQDDGRRVPGAKSKLQSAGCWMQRAGCRVMGAECWVQIT